MVSTPSLFNAKVMHKRFFPRENAFNYGVYYLGLPLPAIKIPGLFASFHPKDLGYRDGSDPSTWARSILTQYGLDHNVTSIFLLAMPRVLGYVFNPVSFYLCRDNQHQLIAVICEVHNTFGEQHTYICANEDYAPISSDQWLEADKVFHVSPFLTRDGQYKFRFAVDKDKTAIWIDYFDPEGRKQLATSLIGDFQALTEASLQKAFWTHPLVTVKAILLIHWQALRILAKKIRYISKPDQLPDKVTATRNLTKK